MRRIIVLSTAVLLLGACQPEAPGGGEAQPPADAPAPAPAPAPAAAGPFAAPFSARGTEPFWRVEINGTNLALVRPSAKIAVAMNATLAAGDTTATWTAQSDGKPVTVTLTRGDCSDGMSDARYGYTAQVVWGDETLKGCGFPTAEEPREGQ